MANRHKGEVAFDEIEPGATLHLNWDDLADLEGQLGTSWHLEILTGFGSASIRILKMLLKAGLRNAAGEKFDPDISLPVEVVLTKCSEAYHLAMHGKTAAEMNAEAKAKKPPEDEPAPDPQTAAAQ